MEQFVAVLSPISLSSFLNMSDGSIKMASALQKWFSLVFPYLKNGHTLIFTPQGNKKCGRNE